MEDLALASSFLLGGLLWRLFELAVERRVRQDASAAVRCHGTKKGKP